MILRKHVYFKKPGFNTVYYIGTMLRFVRAKNCFFGIILCIKTGSEANKNCCFLSENIKHKT